MADMSIILGFWRTVLCSPVACAPAVNKFCLRLRNKHISWNITPNVLSLYNILLNYIICLVSIFHRVPNYTVINSIIQSFSTVLVISSFGGLVVQCRSQLHEVPDSIPKLGNIFWQNNVAWDWQSARLMIGFKPIIKRAQLSMGPSFFSQL